jgi:hypothetical protein
MGAQLGGLAKLGFFALDGTAATLKASPINQIAR